MKTALLCLPTLRPYQRRLLSDPARDVMCVSATQVGKTFAMACWLLARVWEYRGPHVWWWLAPTYNQVLQGVRLMSAISKSAGVADPRSPTMTPYPVLKLVNGKVVEFRSWEREQNLAGTTIAGGVVDEAGLLSPQAHGIISTRRSETLGPLRYIGNPGLVAGPFRKLCSMGERDDTGTYSFHKWTWQDKHAALLDSNPEAAALYANFIGKEKETLPEFEFRRLYEAVWTEDEAAVFRGAADCVVPGEPLEAGADSFVIGVDVAQSVDYLVAVSMGKNTRRLDLRYRARGIGYPQAAIHLHDLSKRLKAPLVVEDNGPGVALIQELVRLQANVMPFTTTAQSKQELILTLAADVQEKRIKIGDQSPMPYEFGVFRYERTPSGLYRYTAPAGEHDDCVMAAALARYGVGRAISLDDYGWIG